MFRWLTSFLGLCIVLAGLYIAYEQRDELMRFVHEMRRPSKIYTIEASFSPEEIVSLRQKELLYNKDHSIVKSETFFLPYVLYDVKFVNANKKTEEGNLLFSLRNGEMVLDTTTFSTTHGFEDCIRAAATQEDFRILYLLEGNSEQMTREQLAHKLSLDAEELSGRLEQLRKKHLIAIKGDTVRIHFQNPLLHIPPSTQVHHPIVLRDVPVQNFLPGRYSIREVNKVLQAAFGPDFAIRKATEIYIPVIEIETAMKGGVIRKTYWNGVTGSMINIGQ